MRFNTAVVIATVTLLIGVARAEAHLWIPLTVLAAGIVDLFTRSWLHSRKRGASSAASEGLRLTLTLIGLYAALGQLACLVLMLVWFIL